MIEIKTKSLDNIIHNLMNFPISEMHATVVGRNSEEEFQTYVTGVLFKALQEMNTVNYLLYNDCTDNNLFFVVSQQDEYYSSLLLSKKKYKKFTYNEMRDELSETKHLAFMLEPEDRTVIDRYFEISGQTLENSYNDWFYITDKIVDLSDMVRGEYSREDLIEEKNAHVSKKLMEKELKQVCSEKTVTNKRRM